MNGWISLKVQSSIPNHQLLLIWYLVDIQIEDDLPSLQIINLPPPPSPLNDGGFTYTSHIPTLLFLLWLCWLYVNPFNIHGAKHVTISNPGFSQPPFQTHQPAVPHTASRPLVQARSPPCGFHNKIYLWKLPEVANMLSNKRWENVGKLHILKGLLYKFHPAFYGGYKYTIL